MKKNKIVSVLVAMLMVVCLLPLTACGDTGVTEVVTASKSELSFEVIEQGKLAWSRCSTATLYSDNTYMIISAGGVYYSSDGGETYSPYADWGTIYYGTCEIVDENAELGERTIKITSIDRMVNGDYDSNTDEAADLANNELIGTELILTDAHELSDIIM